MNFNAGSSLQDGKNIYIFLLFAIVRLKFELLLDPEIQQLKPIIHPVMAAECFYSLWNVKHVKTAVSF